MVFLYLFLCSFFPKSLYTPLTFSHRCTSLFSPISAYTTTPCSLFFFLPLISPSPLSVIGMGLCARIHLIKRTRRTHSPHPVLTHIALSCGKTNCVCADWITSHLSPDSLYLADVGVETVKGKQMKIKWRHSSEWEKLIILFACWRKPFSGVVSEADSLPSESVSLSPCGSAVLLNMALSILTEWECLKWFSLPRCPAWPHHSLSNGIEKNRLYDNTINKEMNKCHSSGFLPLLTNNLY